MFFVLIYEYRWCRDCIDLLISVTYKEADCSTDEEEVDDEVIKGELLPHLTWMQRLKSLVILLGSHSQSGVWDNSIREFTFNWLPDLHADSLERLWVTSSMNYESMDDYGLWRHWRIHSEINCDAIYWLWLVIWGIFLFFIITVELTKNLFLNNRVQWNNVQTDLSQLPIFFKALKPCSNLGRTCRDPYYLLRETS